MPQKCTVCVHPQREAIDQAIVSGQSKRAIAGQFALKRSPVIRHAQNHLPQALVKAEQAQEVAKADTLFDQLKVLGQEAWAILDQTKQAGDLRTALLAIAQVREYLALMVKVAEALQVREREAEPRTWAELARRVMEARTDHGIG